MRPIVPNLWFDNQAEEAATFYVALFPDSRIEHLMRAPAETPGSSGRVMQAMLQMRKVDIAALEAAASNA
ncbi:MAG: VOC family protein [Pseudomonadota bacterium]